MIVDGHGLLGRAFARADRGSGHALVFARGVADSQCEDAAEFDRELRALDAALGRAYANSLPLVYFSGAPIYGPLDGPADERTRLRPVSRYGVHQARAEERVRAARAAHLIVRLPNVVGAGGNPSQLIPSLARQSLAGVVRVQEFATRDIIAVDDVVRAVVALLAAEIRNRTVVVASGISTPVADLARWIAAALGVRPVVAASLDGEPQVFNIDRLRSLVPWAAAFGPDYPRRVIETYAKRALGGEAQAS